MAKLQKDPYSNYVILESTTINSFNPGRKANYQTRFLQKQNIKPDNQLEHFSPFNLTDVSDTSFR